MAERRASKRGGKRGRSQPRARSGESARAIERAMLELVGKRGYAGVTIDAVLARSGSNRTRFYSSFKSKDDCFEVAYATSADQLFERLLRRCAAESAWTAAMRGALEELAVFISSEPDLARGIFSEAGAAGGEVRAKRQEMVARLTAAVDRAREEMQASRPAPPAVSATFVVGAIEAAVLKFLAEPHGRDFGTELPDLLHMAVGLYFGAEAARAEVRKLK